MTIYFKQLALMSWETTKGDKIQNAIAALYKKCCPITLCPIESGVYYETSCDGKRSGHVLSQAMAFLSQKGALQCPISRLPVLSPELFYLSYPSALPRVFPISLEELGQLISNTEIKWEEPNGPMVIIRRTSAAHVLTVIQNLVDLGKFETVTSLELTHIRAKDEQDIEAWRRVIALILANGEALECLYLKETPTDTFNAHKLPSLRYLNIAQTPLSEGIDTAHALYKSSIQFLAGLSSQCAWLRVLTIAQKHKVIFLTSDICPLTDACIHTLIHYQKIWGTMSVWTDDEWRLSDLQHTLETRLNAAK